MSIEYYFKEYLNALLNQDKKKAFIIIDEAIRDGHSIKTIYEEIFSVTMVKIGLLWERNEISIAKEHLCTAITQSIISNFYEKIFLYSDSPLKGKILISCISDELHELGPRMLGDLLELEGWDVKFLGGNIPSYEIMNTIIEDRPDWLGVSVTMKKNINELKELIKEIRSKGLDTKIIVGGLAFIEDESNIGIVDADYFGENFSDSIQIINQNSSEGYYG